MDIGTALPEPAPHRKVPDAVLGLLLDELRELRAHAGTLARQDQVEALSGQLQEFVCESRARERSSHDRALAACLDLHEFVTHLRNPQDPKDTAGLFECLLLRIEDHLATLHVYPMGVRVGSPFHPAGMRIVRTEPAGDAPRFSVSQVHRDGWVHKNPSQPTDDAVVKPAHVTVRT